jgi:hypothetical protein
MKLESPRLQGKLKPVEATCVWPGSVWYEAWERYDSLVHAIKPGALSGMTHLTFDMLVDAPTLTTFVLEMHEAGTDACFRCHFGLIHACQGRFVLPLEALAQNRWSYPRSGAVQKIVCFKDRVDPARVDRITLFCDRKVEGPVRWGMTPLALTETAPAPLDEPLLPRGVLLDEWGQSALHDWPGKTRSENELVSRLQQQKNEAAQQAWPSLFSTFGGWRERVFEATGFFRSHHDGRRWWLVDPEGHAFWSAGLDCVRPSVESAIGGMHRALTWIPPAGGAFAETWANGDKLNHLAANFIRAFGPDQWRQEWDGISISLLRRFGFNTVANWSTWETAAAARFPYVRPLEWPMKQGPVAPRVFRDFPDVWDPLFEKEAAAYAGQLAVTRDDPALIGYFLMNEPQWGFASLNVAEGLLVNTSGGASRRELACFLRKRYGSDQTLSEAWGAPVTLAEIEDGVWQHPVPPGASDDLESFSTLLVERLFATLGRACRAVDPNHLNLGARYHMTPPRWSLKGMTSFDIFSVNNYREKVDPILAEACRELQCPALIGEWHFGALDVGLPATGIGRVATQADRGRAYRVYLEDAAAQDWCVGVHYFTLYDQSAIGRFDGENYNIGFMDVCHRPYEELAKAARAAHERLYQVADGTLAPYDDAPAYLHRIFN